VVPRPRSGSKLAQALRLLGLLEDSAVAIARLARRRVKPRPRPRRGATLRPGVETPLWLTLVAHVRPHLRGYGAKSRLARELGVDAARISQFFVTRTASPDAERTLLLLLWLGRPGGPLLNKQRLARGAASNRDGGDESGMAR
jgi:hypothetical protein